MHGSANERFGAFNLSRNENHHLSPPNSFTEQDTSASHNNKSPQRNYSYHSPPPSPHQVRLFATPKQPRVIPQASDASRGLVLVDLSSVFIISKEKFDFNERLFNLLDILYQRFQDLPMQGITDKKPRIALIIQDNKTTRTSKKKLYRHESKFFDLSNALNHFENRIKDKFYFNPNKPYICANSAESEHDLPFAVPRDELLNDEKIRKKFNVASMNQAIIISSTHDFEYTKSQPQPVSLSPENYKSSAEKIDQYFDFLKIKQTPSFVKTHTTNTSSASTFVEAHVRSLVP